jgi:hypothetical protein
MWHRLRAWWHNRIFTNSGDLHVDTIQKIVTVNALNRRKNTRIKYSHMGAVGNLPRVFINDDEINIGNISTGGLLIVDDTGRLGETVGEIIMLELRWIDMTVKLRARIVGANLHRRHIQFVDFNANVFVRISQLIKSGFLGSKFFKVDTQRSNVAAEELWIGPTNESLVFHKQGQSLPLAELHLSGEIYEFQPGHLPTIKSSGQVINSAILSELLVLLANLRDPSHNVRDLIERLQMLYQKPQRRTGTHG